MIHLLIEAFVFQVYLIFLRTLNHLLIKSTYIRDFDNINLFEVLDWFDFILVVSPITFKQESVQNLELMKSIIKLLLIV